MIKVKKSLSLLIIIFLITSILVFAEPKASSKDSLDEDLKEINSVATDIGSNDNKDLSLDTNAEIASDVSVSSNEKGMMQSKRMMDRKEAFSYENKGYGQYNQGPSYEGYSKESIIFSRVFELIGNDIDPREIKQFCNDTNKIADTVISKLKEKVGDIQKVCSQMEAQESKCAENAKSMCSRIGTAMVGGHANELEKLQSVAYSCPVNQDAIKEACNKRSMFQMEQRIKNLDDECSKRFDFSGNRLVKECERFRQNQVCDKDKYINQCLSNFGVKKEDFDESGKKKAVVCAQDVQQCADGNYVKRVPPSCNFESCLQASPQQCPSINMPACEPGTTAEKKIDDRGCVFYNCIAIRKCPEYPLPACSAPSTANKKVDASGCVYYYCQTPACLTVQKPSCNAGETIQTYYDNAGCVSSYQCITQQTICPDVAKPTCQQGQSLTTKYDDKRCVVGYECITAATTTKTYCGSGTSYSDCYCNAGETKQEYAPQCLEGMACPAVMYYKCVTATTTAITAKVVLNTYDDFVRKCENNWIQQQKICLNTPNVCDKDTFIEKCKEQESKNSENFKSQIGQQCEKQTVSEIKHSGERCSRIDEDRNRCIEESAKRCGNAQGISQKCREILTEEKLRNFIVEEAKKKCKFNDIIEHEDEIRKSEKAEIVLAVLNTATEDDFKKLKLFVDDLKEDLKLQDTTVYKGTIEPNRFGDIKLLSFVVNAKISSVESSERAKEVKTKIVAGDRAKEAASKLVSLRDSDVPKEYLYVIEDKASDVLNVSNNLKDVEKKEEQKGLGYKIKLFLGLAQRAEQEEIKQLQDSKEKLNNSVDTLSKLIDEVPSDVAKSILKEQVENLKKQQDDIEVLIETKEKKSKGLLGLFG